MNDDRPRLVVRPEELTRLDDSPRTMAPIPGSRMFEIKEALAVFRAGNPEAEMFDASQGDGGASLPGVPLEILEAAHALQVDHGTGYDKPFGTPIFRRAVVEDYWQLNAATGWGPENVLAGQGGRDVLVKAYDAAQFLGHRRRGDFVAVSRVPWISYNWGPYAVGANVLLAPGDEDDAWTLNPDAVEGVCRRGGSPRRAKGGDACHHQPRQPDGEKHGARTPARACPGGLRGRIPFVLFDWIYHRVTDEAPHDLNAFLLALDPAERDRCIFLDGITKSLGASNIRNCHLVASTAMVKFMQSRASHAVIPSFHSQAVAIAAYRMGFDRAAATIVGPTNASREVMQAFVDEHGIRAILGKGYYAFLDMGPWIDRAGLADGAELGAILAERFGLAVVPGSYFSSFGARWIRFSYALPPEITKAATGRLWEGLSTL